MSVALATQLDEPQELFSESSFRLGACVSITPRTCGSREASRTSGDIVEVLVPPHHLHREASDPISSLRRSGALILSGAAPEKSVHISERYVIKRVVTDDSSLLTRTALAAHHVVPP